MADTHTHSEQMHRRPACKPGLLGCNHIHGELVGPRQRRGVNSPKAPGLRQMLALFLLLGKSPASLTSLRKHGEGSKAGALLALHQTGLGGKLVYLLGFLSSISTVLGNSTPSQAIQHTYIIQAIARPTSFYEVRLLSRIQRSLVHKRPKRDFPRIFSCGLHHSTRQLYVHPFHSWGKSLEGTE